MGEGKFSLFFRSSSLPKLLGIFPEAQGGQGTSLPGNQCCSPPRHPNPPHPAFLDPSCQVWFLLLAPRPLTEEMFTASPKTTVDQFTVEATEAQSNLKGHCLE